jgi:hypothetical protein
MSLLFFFAFVLEYELQRHTIPSEKIGNHSMQPFKYAFFDIHFKAYESTEEMKKKLSRLLPTD